MRTQIFQSFAFSFLVHAGVCCILTACAVTKQTQQMETKPKPNPEYTLPHDQGTVWFPFSATLKIADESSPDAEVAIRNMSLVLTRKENGKEHVIPLEANAPQTTCNALLTKSKPLRTFYSPRLFSVPQGTFTLVGIRAEQIIRGKEETKPLNILFTSAVGDDWLEPMEFSTQNGRVAALPRTSLAATINENDGVIVSQTRMERKDKSFIPTNIVINALGLISSDASKVFAALAAVPRQRLALETESGAYTSFEKPVARVGIMFDVPCDFSGLYRLIWHRSGDEREYFVAESFSPEAGTTCSNARQVPLAIHFPAGSWSLLATHYSKINVDTEFELPPNLSTDTNAREYFSISSSMSTEISNNHETDIKRKIAFHLSADKAPASANPNTWPLLYAGRLSLSSSPNADGKTATIATAWDRKFSLAEIRKLFAATDIHNVYSKVELTRDQTKDQVQSVMRATAKDKPKAERSLTEFRRETTKIFADCIIEREQIDPLISVSGNLNFSAIPATSYIDFSNVRVDSDKRSKDWIEECVEKKLHAFRLSENAQTRFSGDMRFVLE